MWIELRFEGKARGKQLCRPFATLSNTRDNACRHPEIETAFIFGECDMNDTIAIAWHGHKLGVVPIPGGIEQRAENPVMVVNSLKRATEPMPEALVVGI